MEDFQELIEDWDLVCEWIGCWCACGRADVGKAYDEAMIAKHRRRNVAPEDSAGRGVLVGDVYSERAFTLNERTRRCR